LCFTTDKSFAQQTYINFFPNSVSTTPFVSHNLLGTTPVNQIWDSNAYYGLCDDPNVGYVGIQSLAPKRADIIIFPNPSKDIFQIKNGTMSDPVKSISVKDMLSRNVPFLHTDLKSINLGEQPLGVYFLQIITQQDKTYSFKLIKE
jgi:hypothetical protein